MNALVELTQAPADASALAARGRKFLTRFDIEGYREAVSCFREALDEDPLCICACVGLAETYAYWGFRLELENTGFQGCYDLSLQFAQRALELDPQDSGARRAMAVALRRGTHADPERRRSEASAAVELDPLIADNWYEYWRAFGYGLADPSLRKALSLDPRHFGAYHDMAVALCEQGHMPEAEKWLRMALDLQPNNPLALYNLSMLAVRQGRHAEARERLRRAKAQHPHDGLIRQALVELERQVDG